MRKKAPFKRGDIITCGESCVARCLAIVMRDEYAEGCFKYEWIYNIVDKPEDQVGVRIATPPHGFVKVGEGVKLDGV